MSRSQRFKYVTIISIASDEKGLKHLTIFLDHLVGIICYVYATPRQNHPIFAIRSARVPLYTTMIIFFVITARENQQVFTYENVPEREPEQFY